jgi:hypothetical protein
MPQDTRVDIILLLDAAAAARRFSVCGFPFSVPASVSVSLSASMRFDTEVHEERGVDGIVIRLDPWPVQIQSFRFFLCATSV